MDRKSIIILGVCFIVLMLWYPLVVNRMYPPKPLTPGGTNTPAAALTGTNQYTSTVTNPPVLSPEAPITPKPMVQAEVPEQLIEVTNEYAHYTFTSHGGGLKLIELLRFHETATSQKDARTNRVAMLNPYTPAPTLALLDGEAVQGDGIFKLSRDGNTVRAEKALTNGLTIVKEFQVTNSYLMTATVRLENKTAQPLNLPGQEWVVGTASPMGPRDNGQLVGVMWYNGAKAEDAGGMSYFAAGCRQRVPPLEYRAGTSNVVWVAAHNQFFALGVMPERPALSVVARRMELPRPTGEDAQFVATNGAPPQAYEATLVYPAVTLAANQSITNHVYLYAGPKEYQTLAKLSEQFVNLDLIMSFGWAGFFSKILLLSMNWLHHILGLSYAWAIIAITVIIKLIFWPLTQASTRSMKRMQALQPQMNAIKEKYKDDPVKMNRKTMEFMRENKVSPLGGCLPMILQIPVFFGFYQMIRSAIELRGASFLWIHDLSQPDTLFQIPGTNFPFNLLPLIMGATMLWQAHLTPPSPGMDPAQAKMMRYMPLMFMVFLYNFSAGLTLYWTVQNLLTIAQTQFTKTNPTTLAPGAPVKGPVLTTPPKKRK